MSEIDTTAARREARAAIAAALSCLDADGAAYLARKITPAMDMMTALSDELDDARQTIGVQRAALDGAATTVERYEADLAEACALLSSAMRTAPSAFSYGWIRSAHALLERNAGLIEAHRAPADWRRGGGALQGFPEATA